MPGAGAPVDKGKRFRSSPSSRRTGGEADPLALDFPTVEDGAKGMKMIEAAVESSAKGGVWTDCTLDL